MVVFPTRAVPLKDDSADTRSGWQAMPVSHWSRGEVATPTQKDGAGTSQEGDGR
jgi:hypothetical protein